MTALHRGRSRVPVGAASGAFVGGVVALASARATAGRESWGKVHHARIANVHGARSGPGCPASTCWWGSLGSEICCSAIDDSCVCSVMELPLSKSQGADAVFGRSACRQVVTPTHSFASPAMVVRHS